MALSGNSAIHARKPVVGTSKSCRGYERALGLPRVYRTHHPREFRRLVLAALQYKLPPAGQVDPALRDSVAWREAQAGLPAAFAAFRSRQEGAAPSTRSAAS
jgi:hypothetical protein